MVTALHDNGILTPLDDGYFDGAERDALERIDEIHALMARESDARSTIGRLKRERDVLEATWYRDGTVAGSNAEQRAHALTLARAESGRWQDLALQIDVAESGLAMVQRDLERARELRSLAKRRMEFAIATRQWHAAGEAE